MENPDEATTYTMADLQALLVVMERVVPTVPDDGDYLTRYLILMANYIRELME